MVLFVLVAMLTAPLAFGLLPVRHAAAANGLAVTSTTTYTIDAAAGTVHVLADMTFTNTVPDKRDGNVIKRAYFTGFSLPAPAGAINAVAVTTKGTPLGLTPEVVPDAQDFFLYNVEFASSLFSGQSAHINVTYDITGLPPRSVNPSRINPAYAAFDAFGIGDDGKVSVRVVVPPGFIIDTFGDDAVETTENGNTVYTASDIPNPQEFDLFVSARNDGGLTSQPVSSPDGSEFNMRAWPGDTDWQNFVTEQIHTGLPQLEELIGRPWPIEGTIEVREAYTPYLYGYAGWFSASQKQIEIGEDLDQEVVLHELSHAWFSSDWFADRWLNEGMAQTYSNMAVDALGGVAKTPDAINGVDPARVTLNEWGDPLLDEGADDTETYGYNASWFVVKSITDEVGVDGMKDVFTAVDDKTVAYVGDIAAEDNPAVTDWRRFLDLVDEIGGAKEADDLISRYVITSKQQDELDARTAARTVYQSLDDHGGAWAPPYVVRRLMASWTFDKATQRITEAEHALDTRDELQAKSKQLGVSVPATLEAEYETSPNDLTDVQASLDDQLDAVEAVMAAVTAEAKDDGLLGNVGLIGTHLPKDIDAAKAALSAGKTDDARAAASKVEERIDKAPSIGKQRAAWVIGAALLFLILLVMLLILLRRRRRRRRAAMAAADAEAIALAEQPLAVDSAPVTVEGEDAVEVIAAVESPGVPEFPPDDDTV